MCIDGKKRNLCKRKFCVKCSPFGSKNTRDITQPRARDVEARRCSRCKDTKHRSSFYTRSGARKGELYTYCKVCWAALFHDSKIWAVKHKGGKCKNCGYKKCLSALEFHHRDPSKKDFTISRKRYTDGKESKRKLVIELEKCDLLCANCHREVHLMERLKTVNSRTHRK